MQAFIIALVVKAVENPKIREFLLEFAARLGKFLLPSLMALIPAAAAAAGKVLIERLPGALDLPELPEVVGQVHDAVNNLLPDDVDIPVLSDVVENLTGIDLSQWLTGR